ncbi:MAG TPA: 23S rRNA methyltransferase, partial [Gammaproteobacteria bacterium]|nr:23S rRNA methyltransferase [Gammaproteobacteria bacterium]
WRRSQREDFFLKKAQGQGFVSRAYFKLQELDTRFDLLKPKQSILELGAAPGGWVRYAEDKLSGHGNLYIAVDPLPVKSSGLAKVIRGKSNEPRVAQEIEEILDSRKLDLVLSDMAPNLSGVRAVDQARSMDLADTALRSCERWLAPQGAMAIKAFQGEGLDGWVKALRDVFERVTMTKPKASRNESREVFVVAQGFSVEALG